MQTHHYILGMFMACMFFIYVMLSLLPGSLENSSGEMFSERVVPGTDIIKALYVVDSSPYPWDLDVFTCADENKTSPEFMAKISTRALRNTEL